MIVHVHLNCDTARNKTIRHYQRYDDNVLHDLAPTWAGKHYQQRASAILLDMDGARDEVLQLAGSTSGTVTVGLSTVPHIAFLPIVLEPFKQRYPAVKLTIHEGLLSRMQQDPE